MVETESKLGKARNVISHEETVNVNMTNGHSPRTSNSTYVINTTELR
jgi:hypothetical protein